MHTGCDQGCQFCLEFARDPAALWFKLAPGMPADRSVYRTPHFRALPPLGQFVEGALMLVSEEHCPSIARLPPDAVADLEALLRRVESVLAATYAPPLFFEHGPGVSSKGTCCVDHAHMHAFPVAVDVHAFLGARFPFVELRGLSELKDFASGAGGYLFLQQGSRRYAYRCEVAPSQLVRQVIAAALGVPERWDWRGYLGIEEVGRTLERLPAPVWELQPDADAYAGRALARIRARWDARAATWDADALDPAREFDGDGAYSAFNRFAAAVLSEAAPPGIPLLVDLACGTGLVASALAGLARQVLAVDLSPAMLAVARGRASPGVALVAADAFSLPLRDGVAAAVVSRGVLLSHYGRAWAPALLAEVRRVLEPGGIAVLDYLHAGEATPDAAARGKAFFTDDEVVAMAASAGFTVLRGDACDRTHVAAFRAR